jgi:hypothetical protein
MAQAKVIITGDSTNAQKDLDNLSKKADSTSSRLKTMGGKVAKTAAIGLIGIGTAAAGVAADAAYLAVNFEESMTNVSTLIGGNKERINELGEEVKNIAKETGKPLDDLAGGLYQVISAFGDTGDTAAILETAAKSAAAGLATTEDSVNLLSSVTKAYGDTTQEAIDRVSDFAFQTVKLGQTTFPELAASMGKVTPLASTMNVKMEELFGAMSTLTGVTGSTAEVTTQLRSTIQAIAKPTEDMATALWLAIGPMIESGEITGKNAERYMILEEEIQKLIKARDKEREANGQESKTYKALSEQITTLSNSQMDLTAGMGAQLIEAKGLQETLNLLGEAAEGDTNKLGKMFGSVEGLNAVLALTGEQADNFTEKTKAMDAASGESAAAFDIQQESVAAMMDKIGQNFNVIMIELGEKLLPVLSKFLEWLVEHMPQIEATFSAVFGTIGNIINGTITTIETVINTFVDMKETITTAVQDTVNKIQEWFGDSKLGKVIETVGNVTEKVTGFFGKMKDVLVGNSIVPDMINDIIKEFEKLSTAEKITQTFKNNITNWMQDIADSSTGAAKSFAGSIVDMTDAVSSGQKTLGEALKEMAISLITTLEKEVIATQVAETAKALIQAPLSFGATLAAIPGIIAAAAPALAAFEVLKAGIRGLAEGGKTLTSGWALVGERGPELLNLPQGAMVTPLNETNSNSIVNNYFSFPNARISSQRDAENYMNQAVRKLKAAGVLT